MSIRSENELDSAQAVVDERLREELDEGKQTYLDALSDLVIMYEQQHHAVSPLPPHVLLGGSRHQTSSDWRQSRFLSKSVAASRARFASRRRLDRANRSTSLCSVITRATLGLGSFQVRERGGPGRLLRPTSLL
jgi:hypothetical protein